MKTICTTRIDPDDETYPLKYGKLRKLNLSKAPATDDDIQLIVENLTELTHIKLSYTEDYSITDKTITTLLATEHADPAYPYTTLPNLTHLKIFDSAITSDGLIQLSKSHLFSQLEYLNVGRCRNWNEDGPNLPPGLLALLANSRILNLKSLKFCGVISQHIDLKQLKYDRPEVAKHFQHLANCEIKYR